MSGRSSSVVKVARAVQRLPLGWLRPLEMPLVRARSGPESEPQLVILLALPRSGSTLAYQTLVHGLQPLYLSNLWNLLYGLPWTGGRISHHYCAGHESDFHSDQGFVGGICGPAEGLRFWSYWTGCGLDETQVPLISERRLAGRVDYLRRVFSALTSRSSPMVTGYLGHVLIQERLQAWFPDAIFVRLHRDPLSNAASILRSRQSGSGDWFSVFPEECLNMREKGVLPEVAAQVYWLNRRLAALDGDDRAVHINYEDLCRDPSGTLQDIIEGCNQRGMELTARQPLPDSFGYRRASPDDDEGTALLARELERLETEHGPIR